jgi:hypothetical protein
MGLGEREEGPHEGDKEAESNGEGTTRQGSTRLTVQWCSSVEITGKMSGDKGNVCASHPTLGDPNPAVRGFGTVRYSLRLHPWSGSLRRAEGGGPTCHRVDIAAAVDLQSNDSRKKNDDVDHVRVQRCIALIYTNYV